ncbi:hypothetical protein SeLEV6574_g07397 [Synchytrium endobioticum]|uniref:F5/8 type C domain-containing protein n=1 Tax=Synchytrium endobioticum TaxID=286115 RepID=A0A507CIE3_9FUNG|nr:hypothetical protein SeLEV6574_g07397 [Synchytrium endobioticum]
MSAAIASVTKIRASSTLHKDIKNYGPKNMIDGNVDTCWNSDVGTPQWIQVHFESDVRVSALVFTFQGGFAPKCIKVMMQDGAEWKVVETLWGVDVSKQQVFEFKKSIKVPALRVVFEESYDTMWYRVLYILMVLLLVVLLVDAGGSESRSEPTYETTSAEMREWIMTQFKYTRITVCRIGKLDDGTWTCRPKSLCNRELNGTVLIRGLRDSQRALNPSNIGNAGYISKTNKTLIVAIPPSYGYADYLLDLTTQWTDIPTKRINESYSGAPFSAKVHKGFLDASERILGQVMDAFDEWGVIGYRKMGIERVVLTGHSLGAAVATLLALSVKHHLNPRVKMDVVTFGSPRIGNTEFAEWASAELRNMSYRVSNRNDVIAELPPRAMRWAHIEEEYFVTDTWHHTINRCPATTSTESEECSNAVSFMALNPAAHFNYFDTPYCY